MVSFCCAAIGLIKPNTKAIATTDVLILTRLFYALSSYGTALTTCAHGSATRAAGHFSLGSLSTPASVQPLSVDRKCTFTGTVHGAGAGSTAETSILTNVPGVRSSEPGACNSATV